MNYKRPRFHFTTPRNWINDPNGLYFYKNEYHLFYQHNPYGNSWGHMSWGHAVSNDLVNWKHLPIALLEEDGVMIFSGSAVVDYQNTSGFGTLNNPPIIAIYTGHRVSDGRQFQCIAFSNDDGRTWTKYKNNPVLDIGSSQFRDPKVFWFAPDNQWKMVVALPLEKSIYFYSSQNLIDWNFCSEYKIDTADQIKLECPDIFPLKINDDEDQTKWVLVLSLLSDDDAEKSCCKYLIGKFNGTNFIKDEKYKPRKIDCGKDFYAAATWHNISNNVERRFCIAWMNNWKYASELPTHPWRGVMTIPRELKLISRDENIILVQAPVAEFKQLRRKIFWFSGKSINDINTVLKGICVNSTPVELVIDFIYEESSEVGLRLCDDKHKYLSLGYSDCESRLSIHRYTEESNILEDDFFQPQVTALSCNGTIKLHIIFDGISFEVFANDGEVVMTSLLFPSSDNLFIELFSDHENGEVKKIELWELCRS